jgi:putative DNA primase/helicase
MTQKTEWTGKHAKANLIKPVTKDNPCPHCGKPDWCYRLKELTVCNRNAEPAPGWKLTSKRDSAGSYFYAPIQNKPIRPAQERVWEYKSRNGQPLIRVWRIDYGDGHKPKRWQEKWDGEQWVKGRKGIQRKDIPIYRYQEIRDAIAQGQTIFITEGEPCADALWELGIPATTNIDGSLKWKPSDTNDLNGAKIVLCPDRDQPGIQHAEAIALSFRDAQWLYAFPNSPFWNNLPESQGLDVADWIKDYNLTATDIWEAVEPRREGLPNPDVPTSPPTVEEHYTQKCIAALYSDKPYVSINSKLYAWTGTHYQETTEGFERRRIAQWCNATPVPTKTNWKYAYASATHVDNIWRWLHNYFSVSPDQVNPPGLNCLNGIVKIEWNTRRASWSLVPHDPNIIYTYVSEINFDPNADPTDCERMLSCLEPKEQKLFIQTIAASLDLQTIRKHRGREVKALLCKGHGNNGKDTLREAVRLLFGQNMSHASVSDFTAYDQGRKFCLSKLEGTVINWSSENSSFDSLDRIQSLKAAITGEPLDMERKGIDERAMMLAAVFLFNVNETPNLKAGMEAIQSRWAVLSFNKTYKVGADPAKGELEADNRFRYDPTFLKENVCPALLNKMLSCLATLAIDGIDYSCTEAALQDIQQETNHLWAFAREVGLDYRSGGKTYINDLWEQLTQWYIANGTLEIIQTENGKEKKIWHDQPRRGDKNVKAPNQIKARFAELFPKIKWHKETQLNERKGQIYLSGIGISEASEASEAISEPIGEATTRSQQGSEASEAILPTSAQIMKWLAELEPNHRQIIIEQINQTFSPGTEVPPTGSLPHYAQPEPVSASPIASPTASPLPHRDDSETEPAKRIDWVRYQNEAWQVSSQKNGILRLRKAGFLKVIHTVHISQVEIGGYKQ